MGGHIYYYAVPYEKDINNALQSLRRREFEAGRYNPVVPFLEFESDASLTPSPGKQHASIKEAMDASEADGTRSILDIERIGTEADFGVAVVLPPERLEEERTSPRGKWSRRIWISLKTWTGATASTLYSFEMGIHPRYFLLECHTTNLVLPEKSTAVRTFPVNKPGASLNASIVGFHIAA